MTTINPTPVVDVASLLDTLDAEVYLRRSTVTPGHVDRTLIGVCMARSIVTEHLAAAESRYADYADATVIERCLLTLDHETALRRRGSIPGCLDRTLIGLSLVTTIVSEYLRLADDDSPF